MKIENGKGVAGILMIFLMGAVLLLGGLAASQGHRAKTPVSVATPTPTPADIVPTPTATPDPTRRWQTYRSQDGPFTLRYSSRWQPYVYSGQAAITCQRGRADSSIDFDTQQRYRTIITTCGGENPGEVHVSVTEGAPNVVPTYQGSSPDNLYTDKTADKVTVDGVDGMRFSATATRDMLGIRKGGKHVEYHFWANDKNYSFVLVQNPTDRDAVADFELMVEHTLKFSS